AAIAPDHCARRVLDRIAEVNRADVTRHHVGRARLAGSVQRGPEWTLGVSLVDAFIKPPAPLPVGDADPHALAPFRTIVGVAPVAALVITIPVSCRHSILHVLLSPSPGRPQPS